jgi:uncharacterized membrane protein
VEERRTQHAVIALAVAQGVLFAVLALARYTTFHNETFDLAFYTRIAWGLTHKDFWEPMVNGHIYGLHLSPILIPLGILGDRLGTAPVLLVAQAIAIASATFPIARIGARHLGPAGAIAGAIVWLFYPNIGHVAAYEVHPGTLAVLPLAWIAFGIDARNVRAFVLGAIGTLLCREDLALVVACASVAFAIEHRARWWVAVIVASVSIVYVLWFFLDVHPAYAPERGSLELHFGRFGSSTSEVAVYLITHPLELVVHLATWDRLTYLPKILAPLGFLTLLKPRWLIPALPILAINLVSEWPTATDLDVHYLTPALPFLIAGALDGASRVKRHGLYLCFVPALIGHVIAGGTPISIDHPWEAFTPDANMHAARDIVRAIPPTASVQAPDPLLAHLAERPQLHRTASSEQGDAYYVLDVSHRRRYAGDEDLLRTIEEPVTRTFLARADHAVVYAGGDYLLLERDRDPRTGVGAHAIIGTVDPDAGERIAACLGVIGARWEEPDLVAIDFAVREPCPNDLAIRIGEDPQPRRVDLLFAGVLSPVHLRRGDRVRSLHRIDRREALYVGALRSSGARPEPIDPIAVRVPEDAR